MTSPERLWEEEGLGSTGILGKRRWWEESGALLSTEGKLLQHPLRGSFVLPASHTDKLTSLVRVCNYNSLRNGVFPCAVSLGLALGGVLLSILLLLKKIKNSISHLSQAVPQQLNKARPQWINRVEPTLPEKHL